MGGRGRVLRRVMVTVDEDVPVAAMRRDHREIHVSKCFVTYDASRRTPNPGAATTEIACRMSTSRKTHPNLDPIADCARPGDGRESKMGAAGSASAPAGKAEHSGLVDEKGALQSTPVPLAKVIYALHLPRLLAAIHIVLGHFTPRPNQYVGGVMDWSVWWVDFFFILSGFGAAHGRYHASNVKAVAEEGPICLLYTSPSPRDKRQSRMPSSA